MNTYNTYQEAKKANPESEIYENDNGEFGTRDQLSEVVGQYVLCEPKDHCMTVEKFLVDGHKFVDNDLYLGADGEIKVVGKDYPVSVANNPTRGDNWRFVLRAKALNQTETPEEKEAFDVMAQDNEAVEDKAVEWTTELLPPIGSSCLYYVSNTRDYPLDNHMREMTCVAHIGGFDGFVEDGLAVLVSKNFSFCTVCNEQWIRKIGFKDDRKLEQPKPKHTKEEYVKVEGSSAEIIDEFENGGKFYYKAPSLTKPALANRHGVFNTLRDGEILYRKVVTELTEREAFIEAARSVTDSIGVGLSGRTLGALFDSGKFKLVEGE